MELKSIKSVKSLKSKLSCKNSKYRLMNNTTYIPSKSSNFISRRRSLNVSKGNNKSK